MVVHKNNAIRDDFLVNFSELQGGEMKMTDLGKASIAIIPASTLKIENLHFIN